MKNLINHLKQNERPVQIIVLIILAYIFLFHGIGNYSLKEPDEGRYAEIPREMNALHDYTVPHLNNARYFEKPPLLYWAVAFSFKLFGTNEWAFRFPNALAAFFCVAFLYFFIGRWFTWKMAFLSSIVLLTSFGFFSLARVVTTDMLFTCCLFLSLLFFCGFYREKKSYLMYLFYITAGAATLAKGPVAPILLGGTIFTFLLSEHNFRFIREMRPIKGALLYLIVTLPWIIAISLREKEFLYFFFMDQHILRFLTSKHKRSGPVYYFIPVLLGGMFPWSIFIPRAISHIWKVKELRLMLIWSCLVFAFFSISGSKLPPYILPIFPSLAIILGHLFFEKWQDRVIRPAEAFIYIVIFFLFGTVTLISRISPFSTLFTGMSSDAPAIMDDLHGFILFISLASFTLFVILLLRKIVSFRGIFICIFAFSLIVMVGLLSSLHVVDKLNTTKKLALLIAAESPQPDFIITYSSYEQIIPFYLKKPVVVASYTGELEMGSKYSDSKGRFISEEQFFKLIASNKRVLFTTKKKRLNRLEELFPGSIHLRACQNDRCLISNY